MTTATATENHIWQIYSNIKAIIIFQNVCIQLKWYLYPIHVCTTFSRYIPIIYRTSGNGNHASHGEGEHVRPRARWYQVTNVDRPRNVHSIVSQCLVTCRCATHSRIRRQTDVFIRRCHGCNVQWCYNICLIRRLVLWIYIFEHIEMRAQCEGDGDKVVHERGNCEWMSACSSYFIDSTCFCIWGVFSDKATTPTMQSDHPYSP